MKSKNFTLKIKRNRKVPKAFFGLPLLLPAALAYASNYALNFVKDSTKELLSKLGLPKKGFINWIKPRLLKAQTSVAPQSYYVKGFEGTMNQDLKNRNDVLNFLKMLISQGYNPGTADGVWGKNTLAAYNEYMQNLKLTNLKPVEGVSVTPQTPSSNLTASFTPSFGTPSYKDDWRRGYNQVMNLSYMAKRGGTLVSRNPVKRFKSFFLEGGSLIKPEIRVFKTGGILYSDETKRLLLEMINSGITKVMVNGLEKALKADGYRGPITEAAIALYLKSKGSGNITKNNKFYQLDYNKVKLLGDARRTQAQSMVNNFNNYIEELNKNASKNIESKKKAYQTANKNTKAPMAPNNLSTLQENLWNIGAFNGVKNKRGLVATVLSAIDGLPGSMTNLAIENSKNMGYFIDEKAGTVSKTNPVSPKLNKPKGLASMYEMTHAALTGGMNSAPQLKGRSENFERLVGNLIKSPIRGRIDAGLYIADRLGAPSNATNYLRDLNVSIPARTSAAASAILPTLVNGKSFKENYHDELHAPNPLYRLTAIKPLVNRNENFNEEQLQVIKKMAGKKGYITNSDIKRVSEDGRYGAFDGSIGSYFSPTKVVLTAIGRSAGENGILHDYFDVNTNDVLSLKDNQMYLDKTKESLGMNYGTLRATMPYTSSIDIMPDEYKILTFIDLNKIK